MAGFPEISLLLTWLAEGLLPVYEKEACMYSRCAFAIKSGVWIGLGGGVERPFMGSNFGETSPNFRSVALEQNMKRPNKKPYRMQCCRWCLAVKAFRTQAAF